MRTIHQTMNAPSDEWDRYYQDSVALVTKGLDLEVVRILFLYTTVDFSNNKFEGHIPSIMGDLTALRVLNISHNGLKAAYRYHLEVYIWLNHWTCQVNHLVGEIPARFVSLTSLEVLNLSYNQLEGCIPQGNQFSTFENNSYKGNDGLRGYPFSEGCGSSRMPETYNTTHMLDEESSCTFLNEFRNGILSRWTYYWILHSIFHDFESKFQLAF
ncbi:hypothetical protein KY285_023617 [Solanum tuberosum]|nr:hypothetical protein KY289_023948 [Solanum tuberosum]KAH0675816.1 hypothetical protein KY285_023617 [Solanum tuberosum]